MKKILKGLVAGALALCLSCTTALAAGAPRGEGDIGGSNYTGLVKKTDIDYPAPTRYAYMDVTAYLKLGAFQYVHSYKVDSDLAGFSYNDPTVSGSTVSTSYVGWSDGSLLDICSGSLSVTF